MIVRVALGVAAVLVGGYGGIVLAAHMYDEGETDGRTLHLTRG